MLPNAEQRFIPDSKIRDFLLGDATKKSLERRDFFRRFGFTRERWTELRDALLAHADTARIEQVRSDRYGITFVARGPLTTPDGRQADVDVFWIIRTDDPRPQLTTAIPRGLHLPHG